MWINAVPIVFARRGDFLKKVFEGDPVAIGCLVFGIAVVVGISWFKNRSSDDDEI